MQVRSLKNCIFELLPPEDQLTLVARHGFEQAAQAWVAELWQEILFCGGQAAISTGGSWLKGGTAIVGLRGLPETLRAAANAAAAAGDASRASTLRRVADVLELTLVPAAELSAGQKVDMTANNG